MNYTNNSNNTATISGTVISVPTLSHQIEGENFLEFNISVKRLSKAEDTIPVMISERLISASNVKIGDRLLLKGQYRSYNKSTEEKNKLVLHFFAKDVCEATEEEINEVRLVGYICKTPVYRKTPFDREICDVLLAVNRTKYHRSDYIPCILWGRNARFVSNLKVGTKIEVVGRIQSRKYVKALENGETQERVAYEVSCHKVVQVDDQEEESVS